MASDRIYEDLTGLTRRAGAAFKVFAVLLLAVLGYYWKVQILDTRKFQAMADANRMRNRAVAAPRGLILDRNGDILADNRASFKVSLIRENVKNFEASIASISGLLGIAPEELRSRIEKYKGVPKFEPIIIKDGLEPNEIAPIESRRREFPEIAVDAEPKRSYPFGMLGAHILGYLQERTPEEIAERPDRGLHLGDMGGRTGVERQYDGILTGQDGSAVEIVDSLGRTREEKALTAPIQGREITLTIDRKLQEKAESLLAGRDGAIVAMNPKNGEILAMASYPTYDPNKFISRFTPEEWVQLTNDPASPLENRTIRGLYAPGSIFKLVMALGGLDFHYVTEQSSVYCNGSIEIYGARRACWFAPGHGAMDLPEAIRNSCNIYFYTLGRQMGIDMIAMAAGRMGLGRKTEVDIPGEKEGLVPSTEWKMKALKTPWYPGETISVAIGQGQLQVTPLQLAAMVSLIADRGQRVGPPHLLLKPDFGTSGAGPKPAEAPFKAATFESVIEGMWRSVNAGGTGQAARVEGWDVCGKTGSTQTMSKETARQLALAGKIVKTHSWFCGFAPRNDPEIAVAVLVEFGGGGGATAAPVGGQLISAYKEILGR